MCGQPCGVMLLNRIIIIMTILSKKAIRVAAAICLFAGLAGMIPFVQMHTQRQQALTYAQSAPVIVKPAEPQQPDTTTSMPSRIELPSLSKTLTVLPGQYDTATTNSTLSDTAALFMTNLSEQPNNTRGNTFIYGHATDEVFGRLTQLKPGDNVHVYTENGFVFTYAYKSNQTVKPNDAVFNTAFFQESRSGAPRLTLQTCSGLYSQNRTFYYFDLTGYRQAK